MTLKFLISGSCYAQSHAFSTHFQIFFDDLFLLAKLFPHISCKNALKPINIYYMLHPPYPKILFRAQHGGKILGNSQQWAKIKIIGGMEVKYWGDVSPPSPRDLQPW